MWNSVCHRRDPSFLSSYILGIFLCLNHFTWSCVNKYELQGIFPVWELTSQEYNRDIQAMNMTHALKMDPFLQRVWALGLSASFEPLWKPFFVIWKKKCTSLLPSVRHPILERFILSAQTRSVHPKCSECRTGQQLAITDSWPAVKKKWLEAQTGVSFSLSMASMTSQSRGRAATNSLLEV